MKTPILHSQRGNAMFETLPLLVVFLIFVGFGMGLFGYIHSAVLYSIAARTYAFETFRHRTNLTYHRENLPTSISNPQTMKSRQGRFHFIQNVADEGTNHAPVEATTRPLAIAGMGIQQPGNVQTHNSQIFSLPTRNQTIGLNPLWLMIGYGICLNAACGGSDTIQGGP